MKPDIYWQSLNTAERDELARKVGKSKKQLANIFLGIDYASMPLSVEISRHCDGINPLDLVSPDNRKAVKAIRNCGM